MRFCQIQNGSYRKFNSSLIVDGQFADNLKNEISKFETDSLVFNDAIMRWEFIKYKCREFSMKYSANQAKERKSKRVHLERKIAELK